MLSRMKLALRFRLCVSAWVMLIVGREKLSFATCVFSSVNEIALALTRYRRRILCPL